MQTKGNHQMARLVRHNDESILCPVITYGSPVWEAAATTHMRKIQVIQKKILRLMTNAPLLEISDELGIAQSVISRLWQRFQDDGNVSKCYNTCRPRGTMQNKDRYLAVTEKRNRWSTASDLSRQISSDTGMTVSSQTVYRRLGHIGLYARRPFRCVPLTANSLSPAINLE
ncbi:HTH_Tnp_Tc3_2 domain-containing protein [Trichonephila clavipes]|nr:HTH_Tnp_Tc3_2 domain-containing protein [Trichonephila clavipes]